MPLSSLCRSSGFVPFTSKPSSSRRMRSWNASTTNWNQHNTNGREDRKDEAEAESFASGTSGKEALLFLPEVLSCRNSSASSFRA